MTDRDDRIRETAYFLWLEAGCPEGQAEQHWRDAEARLESELEAFESMRVKGAPPVEPANDSPAVAEALLVPTESEPGSRSLF